MPFPKLRPRPRVLLDVAWVSRLMLPPVRAPLLAAALLALQPLVARGHNKGLVVLGESAAGPFVASFGSAEENTEPAVVAADGAVLHLSRGLSALTLSEEKAELPRTSVDGEWDSASMSVGGVRQWSLFELDTFDDAGTSLPSAPGGVEVSSWSAWSPSDRSFCTTPHDQFLGGHCLLAVASVSKNYTALPAHRHVRVRARVHYIDRWRGDAVTLSADGLPVWSQAHSWCTGFLKRMCATYGIDSCGKSAPDRLSVLAVATIEHAAPTLELSFASSLPEGTNACETSWGVDDVSVELL